MTKKFVVGSRAYFSDYPDFRSHDCDTLIVSDEVPYISSHTRVRGNCIFTKALMSKEEILKFSLSEEDHKIGYLLVPEVVKFFGITIDDLKMFKSRFENINPRWEYQKIIFESYIKNNKFELTDEQRDLAFDYYKKSRNLE